MSRRLLSLVLVFAVVAGLVVVPGVHDALAADPGELIQNDSSTPAGLMQNLRIRLALRRVTAFLGGPGVVKEYLDQGYTARDLVAAASLSKASGSSVEAVFALEDQFGDWKEVAGELGVTLKDLQTAARPLRGLRERAVVGRIARLLDGDPQIMQDLRDAGWAPREMAAIGVLHQLSGEAVDDIASLKTTTNTWRDVAEALGVEVSQFGTYVSVVLGP